MTRSLRGTKTEAGGRLNRTSEQLTSEIAWLYYVKGLTQGEVSTAMNVSRPTVIAHLKHARSIGLVTIKLDPRHQRQHDLADRIADTFGIEDVLIVPANGQEGAALTASVSEVAAHLLADFVAPGDGLGVSWGETLSYVAENVPYWPVKDLVVRQLIGSMANPMLMSAESCTMEIARRLGGQCVNLNAPAVLADMELAQRLRKEPIIAQQLENLKDCNKAIFSLSPCVATSHVVQFNVATVDEIADYAHKGAVCNLVGRFLDRDGNQVEGELDTRLFAANLEDLSATEGLLVVAGAFKAEATLAALRGGFVSRMVVDDVLAEIILSTKDEPRPA